MKFLGLWLIRAYQRCLSPLLPSVCKYSPSCSHYTYQAIDRHGLIAGVLLGGKRLCRCNPWSPGGPDPTPETIRWSWRGPVRKGAAPTYDFAADRAAEILRRPPISTSVTEGARAPGGDAATPQRAIP